MYFSYPAMAVNNTYGIQAVNESIHQQMLNALYVSFGGRLQQNDRLLTLAETWRLSRHDRRLPRAVRRLRS